MSFARQEPEIGKESEVPMYDDGVPMLQKIRSEARSHGIRKEYLNMEI